MILRHSGFHVMPDASHLPGSGREEEHVMPDASHLTNTPASWIGCHAGRGLVCRGVHMDYGGDRQVLCRTLNFCRVPEEFPIEQCCRSTQRAVFLKRRTRLIALTFIDGNLFIYKGDS